MEGDETTTTTTIDTGASGADTTSSDTSSGSAGTPTGGTAAATDTSPVWDVGTWDGKPESVHDTYKPFDERVNKDWESRYKTVEDDAKLYKDIVTGLGDDPRITEAQTKLEELQKKYEAVEAAQESGKLTHQQALDKATKLEAAYNTLLDQQAQKAVETFKEKHKALLGDAAKKQELLGLMDDGWDEEAAAMLVGKTSQVREKAIAIITEHQLRGSGHRLAVTQALSELNPANKSAPGALLTSGANGTVSPVRTSDRNIRSLPRENARLEAARLALVSSKAR
jgi:hypothetical protein